MQVRVVRDACCSQDDQVGPLEAAYLLTLDATVIDLVRAVVDSGFLQFSSTHLCVTGSTSGVPFVTVCESDHGPRFAPQFLIPPETPLAPLVANCAVEFRFA